MPSYIPEEYYWFDCFGVYHKKNVFPIEKINEAFQTFDTHKKSREYSTGKFCNETIKHFGIWESHPIFLELATNPVVLNLCAFVFGGNGFRLDHALIIQDNPNSNIKGYLHGRSYGKQLSHYYLAQGQEHAEWPCWTRVGQLTVGIVLKGQDPEEGGFCYVPGSHKTSYFLPGQEIQHEILKLDDIAPNYPNVVVPKLNPGDLVAFPESLIHGQTSVSKNSQRCVSYNMFFPLSIRFLDWSKQYEKIRNHTHDPDRLRVIRDLPRDLIELDEDYVS